MAKRFSFDKGLNLPLAGEPAQNLPGHEGNPTIRSVGLLGDDYVGMKPTMEVAVGDRVKLGQVVFSDKKTPGVKYVSPGCGTVTAVNRGPKRKFESVVIDLDGDDRVGFASHRDANLAQLPRETVQQQLVDSGLWTALRTRPFSKVPTLGTTPYALFVTALDTNPLAPNPEVVIGAKSGEFVAGLQLLTTLTEGNTWLCKKTGASLPGEDINRVQVAEFGGPHPAGLPGTHIHYLAPVNLERHCWSIGYQDVIAIGHLFMTGELSVERIISIAGPCVTNPRLVRSRLGASLADITADSGAASEGVRTISGSVFGGRTLAPMREHLGRLHNQVTQLVEGNQREFIGWMGPGFNKYSVTRVFASSWLASASQRFKLTTSTEGSHRAIVPLGNYEKVMPLDIIPTPLLKSLCVGDTDELQRLGGLELDEEDLGLCSFVCASKNDYGPMLRDCLATIEREG
ncbi:Na(+)-translocating NADH-quinone reductase subunit A [Botrimarina hoheduenensis]|uniref:Na(+)-translocating NADH-quinone reductase subunit A n=1 Tax=Botrimarina hoheduenensis TaxID=2528000 RepID=A0A5C5VQ52_9BACT|nr:Na(+)-translocating NADH-quinone reductase subunit A [Botrimarina hoheduenensis]TWT40163.1 Na(+)-translocating NADH-quinone reductase subunit A [Botrimarina hoheduenensis]